FSVHQSDLYEAVAGRCAHLLVPMRSVDRQDVDARGSAGSRLVEVLDVHHAELALALGGSNVGDSGPSAVHESGLGGGDVYHPGDPELVDAHAELVAPHLLLEWNRDGAAIGELRPVAAQLVDVVTAEADSHVVATSVPSPEDCQHP